MVSTATNALNITTAGVIGFTGTAFTSSPVTNHAVLVGGSGQTITSVGPSATNTVGGITAGANGVMISNASSVPSWLANGTAGQVLTAQSGAPPAWTTLSSSAITTINIQKKTSSGTYTPTSGMLFCIVEMVGGGGAGGGASGASGRSSVGGGGGGGEYARACFSAATIGASKSFTIGAGGAGNSGTPGSSGGTTSLGSTLLSAVGGGGGASGYTTSGVVNAGTGLGGSGGTSSSVTGTATFFAGTDGTQGRADNITAGFSMAFAEGGRSYLGFGPSSIATATPAATSWNQNGTAATANTGAGGGGALSMNSGTSGTGGAGGSGVILITEFIG